MNEDNYRREEDRKWREKTEHELVTLMTGHSVIDARLDHMDEMLNEIDELLRGDRQDRTTGLLARQHELEGFMARLNAIVFLDSTGKKGLLHDVQELKEGREDRRTILGEITKLLVAMIMSGTITYFWPQIMAKIHAKTTDSVQMAINNAKHLRVHRRHVVVVPVEPAEQDDAGN